MAPEDEDDEPIDFDALDDEEGDRRLAEWAEHHGIPRPSSSPLPADLAALFQQVRGQAGDRELFGFEVPPIEFEGFELLDAMIGGMGLVLEAFDPKLGRKVAIKLPKRSDPEAQAALLDEAKTLARLSHRNVVTVYETRRCCLSGLPASTDPRFASVGTPMPSRGGRVSAVERVLIVMEWIDGVDGHRWLQEPRAWELIWEAFVQAGEGLAAAHEAGIQHRDFKPDNVLIGSDGRVVVADFGLAESLREVEIVDPTCWATPSGTPAYMAPERLGGEAGDARSDQYSYCATFWWGLFGVRPYLGREPDELLEAMELGELTMVPGVEVPDRLIAVLRKGLCIDPDQRYPSMRALLAELHRARPQPDDELADLDPSTLLQDRPWAGWGTSIERAHVSPQVEDKLMLSTGLSEQQVVQRLDEDPRRYLLLALLSSTPHATVYDAIDARLNRDVAIKIHRDRRHQATLKAILECQRMANFAHPNLARIHDLSEVGPWLFAVNEHGGIDLRTWCVGKRWDQLLPRFIEAGEGLTCLHEMGYAHGDIKAANILIQDGVAVLADFGHVALARTPGPGPWDDTDEGHHGGTAGYVAPEVYRYGPGVPGDVLAFAVTIYRCLTGSRPFACSSIREGVEAIKRREIQPPKQVPEGLPKSVLPLLVRAMDPDPKNRPSLAELLAGLRSALEQRQRRRRRAALVVGLVATLAVGYVAGASEPHGGGIGIAEAGLSAMGPLTRAELALRKGDIEMAVDEIYKVFDRVDRLSEEEIIELAEGVERIALTLEGLDKLPDAVEAWNVTIRLYRRAGQTEAAEAAQQAKLTILYQSK